MRRRLLVVATALTAACSIAACGSQAISEDVQSDEANVRTGATLFAERCSGCHTFKAAGAQGGAMKIGDRERVDGPSFDERTETEDAVLYAIRNGGYSGAIMPENIVVGEDAEAVAAFVAKYAGRKGDATPASQDSADATP